MSSSKAPRGAGSNRRVVMIALFATAGMFGFGFALVPLYTVFCQKLGLNGQTEQVAAEKALSTRVDEDRWVTVYFNAHTNSRLPWSFRPLQQSIRVHPGQVVQVAYEASNLSGEDIVGQAIHSVTPPVAATYFKKTECFCYSQQTLRSGESKRMPVVFMVDPNIPRGVDAVTLSYTFLRADKYARQDSAPRGGRG